MELGNKQTAMRRQHMAARGSAVIKVGYGRSPDFGQRGR
jgi:hypothetical protein